MIGSIGENSTRREFLKQAAVGGAPANIAYREKRRVTLEEARARQPR